MNIKNNVKGKNILLLCENFYDYDKVIKEELYKLGANFVFLKNINYFNSLREFPKCNIYKCLKGELGRKLWTKKLINEIRNYKFDIFLCIETVCFVKKFMHQLKLMNPNIKMILFLWDTYETQQGAYKDYRFLFDKVFTFDKDDAIRYNMEYYPDFYIPQKPLPKYEYDLCFVGTANESTTIHRFELVDYVCKFCELNNLKSFLYLRAMPVQSKYKLFKLIKRGIRYFGVFHQLCKKFKDRDWLHFTPLSLRECNKIQSSSRVLLDLNHKNRQGMTINCITAIAHGQKLITTNKCIKDEPFYNPNMIYVMDDEKPYLDITFWDRPNQKTDLSQLRLDNWLLHITE